MQGLINALTEVVPNSEHRFCVMHLYRNMVKDHKGIILRKLLWLAARATTDYMFNKHMNELKKVNNCVIIIHVSSFMSTLANCLPYAAVKEVL